jgi:phospholipase/lecithinase/hemolysin
VNGGIFNPYEASALDHSTIHSGDIMRQTNCVLALTIAALFTGCGGVDDSVCIDDHKPRKNFSAEIVFGDSLADVGTYAVGTVAALGGGKYTINGDFTGNSPALTGKVWPELIAGILHVPEPCAAQTGLDGDASLGFSVPVVNHAGCYGYAQGGARVTNPIGLQNRQTGSPLGQLTVPVVTQIANHLAAAGGRFKGDEVVFVTAGGNDLRALLECLTTCVAAEGAAAAEAKFISVLPSLLATHASNPATAAAAIAAALKTEAARAGHTLASLTQVAVTEAARQAGNTAISDPAVCGPLVATAQAEADAARADAEERAVAQHGASAINGMTAAGMELAALVNNQLIGNGANFVVVNSLPDVSSSPGARAMPEAIQALIKAMVAAFNAQLSAGLSGERKVLLINLFALTHDQAAFPASYGLTNTTMPACGPNQLGGSSLVCTLQNLQPGDVSHYMFADGFHPTPYEHALVARFIRNQMMYRGWL